MNTFLQKMKEIIKKNCIYSIIGSFIFVFILSFCLFLCWLCAKYPIQVCFSFFSLCILYTGVFIGKELKNLQVGAKKKYNVKLRKTNKP